MANTHRHAAFRDLTWLGPSLAAVAGTAGVAYVREVDPALGGVYPACPFHRLTGLWCPGCGMARALHELLTGHIGGALGSNLFVPLVVGLGVYFWLSWLWPTVRLGRLPSLGRVPSTVWIGLVTTTVVYSGLRNLPVAPFTALAP